MSTSIRMFCLAGVALCCAPLGSAQQMDMSKPPKVLSIQREWEKPGRGGMHAKVESQFAHAFMQAKIPLRYLGMSSVPGSPQAWFLSGFNSFANMEKATNSIMANAALQPTFEKLGPQDGDMLTDSDMLIANYREDLSYHPDTPDSIAQMRFFDADIVHVRPGHSKEYEDLVKMFINASNKANTGDHWETFEVVSGAPSGTLIFFSAKKSLAFYDQIDQMYGKKFEDALGEGGQKKMRELVAASVEKEEDRLFAFSPSMSYPLDEWVKADPGFWGPKPMAKPAAKMSKKKAAENPPPAQ